MHPRSPQRPSWALALRLLGSILILAGLLIPRGSAQAAGLGSGQAVPAAQAAASLDEGGSCGETEDEAIVDCGAGLDRAFDEPFTIKLLRDLDVRMNSRQCTDLLLDIWSQEICAGEGRDCGKMNSSAPPGPGPKLASGSSSAQSGWATLDLGEPSARGLGSAEIRAPISRDIEPPVPPPKL